MYHGINVTAKIKKGVLTLSKSINNPAVEKIILAKLGGNIKGKYIVSFNIAYLNGEIVSEVINGRKLTAADRLNKLR